MPPNAALDGHSELAPRRAAADHRRAMSKPLATLRSTALLALWCATACAEPETPRILTGNKGACGSVVQGASPGQVECPSACPVAVEAFRVLDTASCERASSRYVACIKPGAGGASAGAAVLDTPDGPVFIDDPAFDCNREGEEGCAAVETATTERWSTCAVTDDEACDCVCRGDECAFDRFASTLAGCGLPTPCEPLTGETERTPDLLQCYLDTLGDGGPMYMEVDVPMSNDVTGETTTARRVVAVSRRVAIRLDELGYHRPSSQCELQDPTFYFNCDPDEPMQVNVENDQGLIDRVPCSDPRAWLINCDAAAPVCP